MAFPETPINNPNIDNPPAPEHAEQQISAIRRLEIAVARVALHHTDLLVEKLEDQERVSSSTARRALGHRANPEAASEYDDPDYKRPIGMAERTLSRYRMEKARRLGRREYRRKQRARIYGDHIQEDIPSRKERVANGDRVTRSEHRHEKKAGRQYRRFKEGVVIGTDIKQERLQKIVDRETRTAKVRQSVIKKLKNTSEKLRENAEDENELHIPQIRSLDLSEAIQRRVERLGPGKFGESAPDNPDSGGNRSQNPPRPPRNPSPSSPEDIEAIKRELEEATVNEADLSQMTIQEVLELHKKSIRALAAQKANLAKLQADQDELRALREEAGVASGADDNAPPVNLQADQEAAAQQASIDASESQAEPDDSEPSQDIMYGGHKITLPFGEYVRFPDASGNVEENAWVLTGYKASTGKVTLSKYPENPENHETKEVSIEEYADFNRLLRPKKRPSIFSYFT